MLVLTRKVQEQILIGDDIKVTLIRCQGNKVRIGIEAPREVRVVRGELEPLAQRINLADDADDEFSERKQAFAHPVKTVRQVDTTPETTNRITDQSQPIAGNGPLPTSPQVFVGSVDRSGNGPRLVRAPLAAFVAAS